MTKTEPETRPPHPGPRAFEVISGWDAGLEGMKVGGRRELIVPSNLAYGENGFGEAVGPGETLVYVIDLLEME